MKKFFSLVLALVMALSLTTVAWGATTVTNETDLKNAVLAGGEVVLGGDVEITESIRLSSTATVDLAGHKLTGPDDGSANWYAFIVETGGKLTLKDSSTAQTGVLFAKCYGVETKGGTFVMESGKIDATTNGGIGAAIVNYGGTVIVNDGEIVASHAAVNTQSYFAAATTEINGGKMETESTTSAVVQVGEEYSRSTETVTINGGEIIGTVAVSVDEDTADVTIAGGDVEGTVAASAGDLTVTGGTYTDDVSEYVADGSSAVLSGGKLVVSVGNTGNTNSYDASDVTIVAKDGSKVTIATDAKVVMTQESKKTVNGKFASVIPAHFTYNGVKYVVCHEMSATHLVTVKGVQYYTCAFNGFVPTVEKDGGALYTAPKKATCGKVGANEDKYVVIDNIYYLVSNLGTRYVLVNDKMVVYSTTTATAEVHVYDAVKSELKYNSDRTVANFKCAVCNNAIPVVAKKPAFATNYTAITLGVEGTYYYVTNTAGISAGSTTPSTDKVTSADTFDAGIAMYVGMSVMAAAGSVVVLKKRED